MVSLKPKSIQWQQKPETICLLTSQFQLRSLIPKAIKDDSWGARVGLGTTVSQARVPRHVVIILVAFA